MLFRPDEPVTGHLVAVSCSPSYMVVPRLLHSPYSLILVKIPQLPFTVWGCSILPMCHNLYPARWPQAFQCLFYLLPSAVAGPLSHHYIGLSGACNLSTWD
jgi:hypothetical protein